MQNQNIFITGATGFIGRELVKRILKKQGANIYLLIRRRGNETAENRFSKYIIELSHELKISLQALFDRVWLVEGHLEAKQFGLNDLAFQNLAENINTIFHLAASVKLHDSLENLCKVNIGGTQEILKLASLAHEAGNFQSLQYLSTAYVAGKRKGLVKETELIKGQDFICNYEMVKFEAERIVENAKTDLPVTIYRPGMVVGDSNTGMTCAFNVIYEPLKMMLYGKLPLWSANRESVIDVVPVNYVCDALMYLASIPEQTLGKTFHLTVGAGREITSRDLRLLSYTFLQNHFEQAIRKPYIVPPIVLRYAGLALQRYGTAKFKRRAKSWITFADYTTYHKSYDNSQTTALLKSAGIVAPRLEDYLSVLCEYALQQNFGRKKNSKPITAVSPNYFIRKAS